jgi:forespore regulator of the sigma-K checkpoint
MSILKKIKKILRRYRGLIAIGVILFAIGGALTLGNLSSHIIHPGSHQEEAIDVMAKQPVKLILKTNYICGTEISTKEFDQVRDMEEWLEAQKNTSWTIVEAKKDSEYTMSRNVLNDLSPLCKKEGYFGLSKEGVLTMFQGPPTDNHVIQTFFRIDTQLLESKLPKEKVGSLKQGIRVHSVDDYLNVLSTFEEFAAEY